MTKARGWLASAVSWPHILAGRNLSRPKSPGRRVGSVWGGSTCSGPLGVGVVAVVLVCLPEYLTKAFAART